MEQEYDISNNVVAILLVTVLVVSALGTWALVSTLAPEREPAVSSSQNGYVGLTIRGSDPGSASGKVVLSISSKEDL